MDDLFISFSDEYPISKNRRQSMTILGLCFCIISIAVLIISFGIKGNLFAKISFVLLFFNGMFQIILNNPENFKWTKCFFQVSNTAIIYKTRSIGRITKINWTEVKLLTLDKQRIYFTLENNKKIKTNLTFIQNLTFNKIEQTIKAFADENGVNISTMTSS